MSPRIPKKAKPVDDHVEAMLALGIERVPVDYFHWNGFRYSTLKDAFAAARRAQPGGFAGA